MRRLLLVCVTALLLFVAAFASADADGGDAGADGGAPAQNDTAVGCSIARVR
jgi:hypothetical protein